MPFFHIFLIYIAKINPRKIPPGQNCEIKYQQGTYFVKVHN